MRVVITTCTHVNCPLPVQACGTGEPGSATGGECKVTLLLNPVVDPQGTPPMSNQVAEKEEGPGTSQPFE